MNRKELFDFIESKFSVRPEFLWDKTPNYAIFRKSQSKKWFGAVVDIPLSKLYGNSHEIVDVLNVKAPRDLVPFLLNSKGIYPAYHMNKKLWISVILKEVQTEFVKDLLEQSFELC